MTIKITWYPKVLTHDDANKAALGEVKEFDSLQDLSEFTLTHAYSPFVFEGGRRLKKAACSTRLLVLDEDGELSLATAFEKLKELGCGFSIAKTRHHQKWKKGQPPADRFRIVILLNREVLVNEYEVLINWAFKMFPGSDEACRDTARFFFKSEQGMYQTDFEKPSLDINRILSEVTITKTLTSLDEIASTKTKEKIIKKHKYGSKPMAGQTHEFLDHSITGWPGEWNIRLNKAAFSCQQLGWSKEEFMDAALKAEIIFDEKDLRTIESGFDPKNEPADKATVKDQLLNFILERVQLNHSADNIPYMRVSVPGTSPKCYIISSSNRDLYDIISGWYYKEKKIVVQPTTIDQIIPVLKCEALHERPMKPLAIGVCQEGEKIYICANNKNAFSYEVECGSYQGFDEFDPRFKPCSDPPVNFLQSQDSLSYPCVYMMGFRSIREVLDGFFELVNISNVEDRFITATWMVSTFLPLPAFPVLILQGEQGSGKSTATKLIHKAVDPRVSTLINIPDTERDIFICAEDVRVLCFDNVSVIKPSMSDVLCKLATGGTFSTRTLTTDRGRSVFKATRPMLINGIDILPDRADLLSRSICIQLSPIVQRVNLENIFKMYGELEEDLFAALMQCISYVLPKMKDDEKNYDFRMADFAKVGNALESLLGYPPGFFNSSYSLAQQEVSENLLVSNKVVQSLMKAFAHGEELETSASELLVRLRAQVRNEDSRYFPQTAASLGKALKRIAPELRRNGVMVGEAPRTSGARQILIRMPEKNHPIWSKFTKATDYTEHYDSNDSYDSKVEGVVHE